MRNILHINQKENFEQFLISEGYVLEQPDEFQCVAIRAIHKQSKKIFLAYKKIGAKEHLSVQDNMCGIVRKYIASKKGGA